MDIVCHLSLTSGAEHTPSPPRISNGAVLNKFLCHCYVFPFDFLEANGWTWFVERPKNQEYGSTPDYSLAFPSHLLAEMFTKGLACEFI